jgi:putative CocE/NonD family hydrolase
MAVCVTIDRVRPLGFVVIVSALLNAQPVHMRGFADDGVFLLYLNDDPFLRAPFRWTTDGVFENEATLRLNGQSLTFKIKITPTADGRWNKAVYDGAGEHRVFDYRNGEYEGGKIKINTKDGEGFGVLRPNTLIYDSTAPALISLALRQYDSAKGGAQMFAVLTLTDGEKGPLTLERGETTETTVAGKRLELTHWRYSLTTCDLNVLADAEGLVYVVSGIHFGMNISEQHTRFVRDGYEDLIRSTGINEVRVETIQIPLRDGVRLATDVYHPVGIVRAPVILIRTPYGKGNEEPVARFFARHGYVVAAEDVRGQYDSEGKFEPLVHEGKDGYDAIEWLARQPWSSGKVGMIGASYLGWAQWMAAVEHPPHLATIIPNVSPPDMLHNIPWENGVFGLTLAFNWLRVVETAATGKLSNEAIDQAEHAADGKLNSLPVIDLDKSITGKESALWRNWVMHPPEDRYWRRTETLEKIKKMRIPVFHESGWYDGDLIGTELNYLALAANPKAVQKMTIGPWGHEMVDQRWTGGVDSGLGALIDMQNEYLRWLDHWLKGFDNGVERESMVNLFVMGSDKWVHGAKYPLPGTKFENLYLASGNSLSFSAPDAAQTPDHYTYDPADPTPDKLGDGRKDALVYLTAVFEKPYMMAGPLEAVIFAATSARDTDWFVHIMDVDEEGHTKALCAWGGGRVRARYRASASRTSAIKPGKIYEYKINLWLTGITIAAGHRLRVEVASAAFPVFDRNLNTGGNNETETKYVKAEQTIYHDALHPSHIVLPRISER